MPGMTTRTHDLTTHPVDLTLLKPHPRNPRNGDIEAIAESLLENGQYRPVVLAVDGTILAGNHTYAAALSLGWTHLAAVRLDLDPDSPEAYRLMLADNRTSDLGNYDDGLLLDLLSTLTDDLAGTGYTETDVDRLHARLDDTPPPVANPGLADRFGVPPLSVLRIPSGDWQARKRQWLDMGLRSQYGRDMDLVRLGSARDADWYEKKRQREARLGRELTAAEWNAIWEEERETDRTTDQPRMAGTSVFDPVLCELIYRWFAPPGGAVYDPCAGGSVRGLVASTCGLSYTGIDIREAQVAANLAQAAEWTTEPRPVWRVGDGRTVDAYTGDPLADLAFTCPPYFDLEVYGEDPRDLSAMTWDGFRQAHRDMIRATMGHLAQDRFAVWVVSDVRDKRTGFYRGLVADTIAAFAEVGVGLYNDLVLLEPIGSAKLRAGRYLTTSRKITRIHQHVLVFVKGDPAAAHAACGPVPEHAWSAPMVDVEDPDYAEAEE